MKFLRKKRPVPPKPEPHPLLGGARLDSEYGKWFYKLPQGITGNTYQLVWADQADSYAYWW